MKKETELEKGKAFDISEIIEYVQNSVVIKTILKKATGNISAVSCDLGEGFAEKTSPFDTFLSIIEGKALVMIDSDPHHIHSGQSIIVPAHMKHGIRAIEPFKMISTVIKSGYEEVIL